MRRVATYRFQLTPAFRFEHVVAQLDRLQQLGVSHAYLSPVTEAVPGSSHGYDVVDHTRIRDELGGLDGLTALLDAAASRRMGVVVDHVANHAAVGRAELNRPWWSMLREGRDSEAARWFDVDWEAGGGKVILPVLGEPLDAIVASMEIVDGELRVGPQRFPLAAGTADLPPADALERQHYRLQHWERPERNVRRFFTIDDLVAVRVEDPLVAAAVDTVPRLLSTHDGFAGVRVDHVDGLADPRAYLEGLRRVIGDDRWLLVEKILAPGERLPEAWPVDGTTGYEHAAVLEHALLDADGWDLLRRRWVAETGDRRPFRDWELDARREVLAAGLRPDLERVARVAADRLDADEDTVEAAVAELSVHLDRYRTYLPDDEGDPALTLALAEAAASQPRLAPVLARLVTELRDSDDAEAVEWRTRWQQLTGPATAKGVEDRAFWRYVTLASLDEVGGFAEPLDGVDPVAALHEHHAETAARWPTTLLAGTTHDTKRSEDVRAAGLALAGAVAAVRRAGGRVVRRARLALRRSTCRSSGWRCRRVVTTPGSTGPRLSRVPRQGRPRGRRAHGVDRSRRTVRAPARPPRRRAAAVGAGGGVARRARRAGPGGDARHARRAVDGSWCRRHLPGDRSVPVPAGRPRQPHPARPRGARRAGR